MRCLIIYYKVTLQTACSKISDRLSVLISHPTQAVLYSVVVQHQASIFSDIHDQSLPRDRPKEIEGTKIVLYSMSAREAEDIEGKGLYTAQ